MADENDGLATILSEESIQGDPSFVREVDEELSEAAAPAEEPKPEAEGEAEPEPEAVKLGKNGRPKRKPSAHAVAMGELMKSDFFKSGAWKNWKSMHQGEPIIKEVIKEIIKEVPVEKQVVREVIEKQLEHQVPKVQAAESTSDSIQASAPAPQQQLDGGEPEQPPESARVVRRGIKGRRVYRRL